MRGALGMSVLKVLAAGPTYGYAVATALEEAGFGSIKGGTLYPLLTRFESAGFVTTEWRAGDGGPGRKYFSLTDAGRTELAQQSADWRVFTTRTLTHLNGAIQ
ncbi:PadR family transcriptional regulator [Arthrobacter sp. HLT1-21]